MKIWGFLLAFAFVMERQINPPRFSFAFASHSTCWARTSHNNRPHSRKIQIPIDFLPLSLPYSNRDKFPNPRIVLKYVSCVQLTCYNGSTGSTETSFFSTKAASEHVPLMCSKWEINFYPVRVLGRVLDPPIRMPNPSPTLDKNLASMGPGILSSIGVGVWRKAREAFPGSNT